MEGYLSTVLEEASLRKAECTEPFNTVYFGGGTPSLIPAELFFSFIRKLKAVLPLDAVCEWTAEANPGTVSNSWLDAALASGINRLSVGMQAAQSGILSLLGRIHRPEDIQRTDAGGYGSFRTYKTCSNCGYTTDEDFQFCPKCGREMSI